MPTPPTASTTASHLIGPPGPTEGVINSVDDARQAVRQRYKDGSDVIKITATGGVLSYAKSGDAPQFTVDEVKAIVDTARDYGYRVAAHAHGEEGMYRAVAGGVTSIEHGTYMSERVMTLMKEKGTWYVPDHVRRPLRRRQGEDRRLLPRDRAAQGGAHRRADPGHRRPRPIAAG
jgi:imidazolonepropionase-like amidohydrolase